MQGGKGILINLCGTKSLSCRTFYIFPQNTLACSVSRSTQIFKNALIHLALGSDWQWLFYQTATFSSIFHSMYASWKRVWALGSAWLSLNSNFSVIVLNSKVQDFHLEHEVITVLRLRIGVR